MDRQQPVARLEPVAGSAAKGLPWQTELVRRGLVRSAKEPLEVKALGTLPLPEPRDGGDILAAILSE